MIPDSTDLSALSRLSLPAGAIRRCLPGQGLESLPTKARVLIIRLRSMGDVILMTPALRMLHEWRPDLEISVLLDPAWIALLGGNPAVRSAIALQSKVATLRAIRREKFDAIINLHGGPTSALLTKFGGSPLRVGLAPFRSPSAYNLIVPRTQDIFIASSRAVSLPQATQRRQERSPAFHTAEHVAAVFFWLGVPAATIPAAQLFPSAHAKEEAARRLAALGLASSSSYAVIHAAALYATKQWSAAGFADVAKYVESRYGFRPILVGGRNDEGVLRSVEQQYGKPLALAINWPIAEMAALIGGAHLFVGNDSGPAHAAAALGVPVAVIFSSSSSALWGPWRAAASAIVQNPFDCNPCAGDRCYAYAEPRCILSISTAQVREAIDSLMEKSQEESHGERDASAVHRKDPELPAGK